MSLPAVTLAELRAEQDRRKRAETLGDEAERLSGSLSDFIAGAWEVVEPFSPYVHGWHIDAMSEKLEAVTAGEIRRLQIWVPPGSMKSRAVSIMWPAWEWTTQPGMRYLTVSYDLSLSMEFAGLHRMLVESDWYQARWPLLMRPDSNVKRSFTNMRGGSRFATSPGAKGGTGRHAHRVIIDDAIDAKAADSTTLSVLYGVNEWHDGTIPTRYADPKTGVEVIVQQRLHEEDLAGHLLGVGDWEVLCLPERYEPDHPFVWPDDARDPGELLWPDRIDDKVNAERQESMGSHRAAGQLQQRPAPREGTILKRTYWRYYSPDALAAAHNGDVSKLPKFTRVFCDWDTSFKEKSSSDYVAGGAWGVKGSDMYLLDVVHEQMGLAKTKQAMIAQQRWLAQRWPGIPVYIIIEKAANGVEILEQLKRELQGVKPFIASVDKTARAEAAEPAFESGNIWVPGAGNRELDNYDPTVTPAWVQGVIEECAVFPGGSHDDRVDMVTMAINWNRSKTIGKLRAVKPTGRQVQPPTSSIPRSPLVQRRIGGRR